MMDQCVNVVRVAPVVPLGAAIVIILTFTAAVMLNYADLKVFEKGRTWYSRIVWYMTNGQCHGFNRIAVCKVKL